MLRRLALVLGILLLVPLLAIPGWVALNRSDLPDPGDADLLRRVEVPEARDGYSALQRAAAAVELPSEDRARLTAHRRGETLDAAWLEERVRANREAFAALERGLAMPALRLPAFAVSDPDGRDVLGVLMRIQTLVRLSVAEAHLRLARGDPTGAIERARVGLRVGHALGTAEEPNLVAMMTGVASRGISLEFLEHLIREVRLPPVEARALVERIEASRWPPEAWERVWAAEYRSTKRLVLEGVGGEEDDAIGWASGEVMAPGGDAEPSSAFELLPSGYAFQQNRTLAGFAEVYRELGRRGALSCRAAFARAMPGVPAREADGSVSPWGKLALLLRPNPVGAILIAIATPNFTTFDLKRCHTETRTGLVQTMAALAAYEAETGALPDRLEDLVPEELPAVPEDRFDGEPLRYAKAQRVVWSVGDDFTDDGPPEAPSQTHASAPAISLAR